MIPERCNECGSPLIRLHNDSDREFWAECQDCDAYICEINKSDYLK